MSRTARSFLWLIVGLVAGGLLVLALVCGGVWYAIDRTAKNVDQAVTLDTNVSVRPSAAGGRVAFALTYGKTLDELNEFEVLDADQNTLWRVRPPANTKPTEVVYGVVPDGWTQVTPANGPAPDVKGKRITYRATVRYSSLFGPARHTVGDEFDVP